jgi:hypothetical protein
MAKPKPKPVKPKKPAMRKRPSGIPDDYLRGSKFVGEKYTAWDTYGQGRPDLGKGAGPGEPYREIQKTVRPQSAKPSIPPRDINRPSPVNRPGWGSAKPKRLEDARARAIRKRLGWM